MGIEKHLSITGTSSVSWKDAVVQAVADKLYVEMKFLNKDKN